MTEQTTPEPLVWRIAQAGHYVAGDPGLTGYTVRRDQQASLDNRWSLRHGGKVVSAHRLLKSAKRAAQVIADAEASQPVAAAGVGVHGEPYVQPAPAADAERMMPRQLVDLLAGVVYSVGARVDRDDLRARNAALLPAVDRAVALGYLSAELLQITDAGIDHLREQRPDALPTRPGAVAALDAARRVIVIPCGAAKSVRPARARDLYIGQQFALALRAAEAIAAGGTILVLSARYGLVPLDAMLAPYEQRIDKPGAITPAVLREQAAALGVLNAGDVTVLAGRAYGDAARTVWPHAVNPLDGSAGIGEQRGRLAAMVRNPDTAAPLARQPEQQHAQADQPAPVALPAPAARPTPVEAVTAHYRDTKKWPAASDVVRRGADLDELHQALGAGLVERVEYGGRALYLLPEPNVGEPLRIDDVVTVDPLRCGRQFDVINDNTTGVDPELLQVFPRRPVDIEDTGQWVGRTYTHRVPAEVVVPYEEDDDDEPTPDPEVAARVAGRLVPGMSVDTGLPPVGAPRDLMGPIDRTAITSRRIGSLMDSGVDPDEVLRQILPVATDQPEQVRAWMTRHGIDPQALVPGEVADAIAADQAEALDANDAPAYRDPAVSGRWAGADDAGRVELLRAAEAAAHEIDEHLSPAATPAADAAVYQVGALVVRKNDTAGYRVLRVTACTSRGGVTAAPYVELVDTFDGTPTGCYAGDVRPASLAEGLRISAPEQYREVLVQLLAPHGFTAPEGVDRLVLDMPDDGAFVIHDPTGVALCTMRDALRVAYPAVHAGEGDGDVGIAWLDLAYGTRYETVADVAVGLVHRLGQAAHASHMRDVADQLRELAGHPLNRAAVLVGPKELRELADRLVPPLSECKAAGYARRTTAVMHGVLVALYRLAEGDELVDPNALRGLAMRTVDLMTTPELLTAEGVAEHLAGRAGAALVADESVLPADVDGLIDTMRAAGYTLAPEVEFVGGRRVRYLTPPAAEAVAPPTSEQPAEATPPIDRRPPAYDFRLGDTWIDESNRQFRTIWRVAPDSVNGAPALFEANGPGYIPAVHLGSMRGAMRLVSRALHDERELPFEADGQVQPGYVAGWCMHRVAVSEWRAGLRVCERCPAPGEDHGDDIDDADVDAVLDAPTAERPLTRAQRDSAECGKTFTAGSMGNSYPCARPPHPDDDGIGCSVQRHPRPADRIEAAAGDDELPDGVTLVAVDDLVDAGGFLSCGCHGSAREHDCGPAAGDAFDPAAEV